MLNSRILRTSMRRLLTVFAILLSLVSLDAAPRKHATHHVHRSAAARHAFERQTGYPHGRPGYVIDHIIPLACGGPDTPSNMQWQTVADARAKDKVERLHC